MLVRKYGGSSLVSADQIHHIAKLIPNEPQVIVVSAPYGRTNQLYQIMTALHCKDEQISNQFLALGEYESCLKLQMALQHQGKRSKIMSEKEKGVRVDQCINGQIVSCDPGGLRQQLAQGYICIVPGFQALDAAGNPATLNRGGSDDTAVALAISLGLDCIIHSNVSYIYDHNNQPLDSITYRHLLGLILHEAPMSARSISMAQEAKLPIRFRHWNEDCLGTIIGEVIEEELLSKNNEKQLIGQ